MRTDIGIMLALLSIVIAASWLLLSGDRAEKIYTTISAGRDSVKLPAASLWLGKPSLVVTASHSATLEVYRQDAAYYAGDGLKIESATDELQPGEGASYRAIRAGKFTWWTRELSADDLRKKGVIK